MSKTELTTQLGRQIYFATKKMGVFGCFEVTIGWSGQERVDYMTYDTKGIFRCYEIKVSKADFYSKAKKSFIGHFNYFVITQELYEIVKEDIPKYIGVYLGSYCVKKAKKQELLIDEQVLKDSMIRSLSRETDKLLKSNDPNFINRMNRLLEQKQNEARTYRERYYDLQKEICEKYGTRWRYN